jgi:carboxymethylenebutenolidase
MCYEPTARPPLPPIAGASGVPRTADLVLEAGDGNRFNVFSAQAEEGNAPGIMILPDIRGLHPFYKEVAVRFAEAGVHATAMDYFGRTAGTGERREDFDHMSHVMRLTPDGIGADTAATVAHLRSTAGGGAERVYSVGFCMGGRISFNQAWRDHGLAGVIGFYGGPQGRGQDDATAPVRLAPQYRCPVLGLFGGADANIPIAEVERFRQVLDDAGVPNEIVIYEGAPHSFFDWAFDEYASACDDAWRRMLQFVGRGPEGWRSRGVEPPHPPAGQTPGRY